MRGVFVTFEGTEGSGKSTQIRLLAERISTLGRGVITLREPGGTPIGEEIRHTLKHSAVNRAMCAEAELLLMNASRAQLVREVIRPALAEGKVVLCDRFFDSTIAYQTYGRQLDPEQVAQIIQFAIENAVPDLTLLLRVPLEVSEARRAQRGAVPRDRLEEEGQEFFRRVEQGYDAIASAGGDRVRMIDATQDIKAVAAEIWRWAGPLLEPETG